jgi:Zn-dependent protease
MSFDPAFLRDGAILFLVLLASLCIHEWAHAFTADKLGDGTPRRDGRVTLNPAAHIDLFGTIILPLMCIFVIPGGFFLAWGRPVVTNPSNYANPRRDDVIVTAAGPLANLGLALLAALVGGLATRFDARVADLAFLVIRINAFLAVFNLIPLPPLDGGNIMRHIVGMKEETYLRLTQWSFFLFIGLMFLQPVRVLLSVAISVTALPFTHLLTLLAQ